MNPFTRLSRHRDNHERGATLILVAISMTTLIAASGMAVDLGRTFVTNRSLQLVADAAALDSARYIAAQETLTLPSPSSNLVVEADNSATNNGSGANLSVIEGLWTSQTFTPESGAHCKGTTPPTGNLPCNAVEVTATSNLARLFSHGTSTLSRTAVAADTPEAAFSIGSYLASMGSPSQQTSVLGVLLGKLGASANLTAVGYAGLANTFVSVQQLINASGGILTPTNVMSATLSAAQWDSFLNGAVSSQAALLTCGNTPTPYPCAATSVLRPFVLSPGPLSSTSLQLCQIVSVDGSSCGSQLSQVALSTNLNVLQTLTTEAELANGASGLDVTAALGLTDTLGQPDTGGALPLRFGHSSTCRRLWAGRHHGVDGPGWRHPGPDGARSLARQSSPQHPNRRGNRYGDPQARSRANPMPCTRPASAPAPRRRVRTRSR